MQKKKLIQKFGSPLFIVDRGKLLKSYNAVFETFSKLYPNVKIAYAYKANYLLEICKTFHKQGAWAEVVGDLEFDLALKIGVNNVIVNGPWKPRLNDAVENGFLINLDNFSELKNLEKICKKSGKKIDVCIRINSSQENLSWNRFGFNFENGQFKEIVEKILNGENINIVGIHIHIGTNVSDLNLYRSAIDVILKAVKFLREKKIEVKIINLGGGGSPRGVLVPAILHGKNGILL